MMASCSPKLRSDPTFSIGLFSPLGPHSGSGAVPLTPALPGYCLGIAGTRFTPARAHARACRRVRAQARMCHSAKGSCNPTRLLEAAELLEADQRKHEGGQSKGTSSTFWIALRLLPCLVQLGSGFAPLGSRRPREEEEEEEEEEAAKKKDEV